MVHRHQIRVRYGETDQMGVVHHSVYPLYFEEGRTELMRSAGVVYADLERRGILLPLVMISLRFHHGPGYDEVLSVETRLTRLRHVRLRLDYRVLAAGDDRLLVTGHTEHAVVDRSMRPCRLPEDVRSALGAALESGGEEDTAGRRLN